jgi:nucleoid-associated protein YgaU
LDRFEELKHKYKSVLDLAHQKGVRLANLHVQDNKLYMKGASPSQEITNAVWNQIKAVDANFADLTCDLSIDASLAPPPAAAPAPKTYTVKAGDSLWKIAQHEYGNGSGFDVGCEP